AAHRRSRRRRHDAARRRRGDRALLRAVVAVGNLYLIAAIAAAAFFAGAGSGWKLRDLAATAELAKVRAACTARESAWERAARESEARQRQIETERRAAA